MATHDGWVGAASHSLPNAQIFVTAKKGAAGEINFELTFLTPTMGGFISSDQHLKWPPNSPMVAGKALGSGFYSYPSVGTLTRVLQSQMPLQVKQIISFSC